MKFIPLRLPPPPITAFLLALGFLALPGGRPGFCPGDGFAVLAALFFLGPRR